MALTTMTYKPTISIRSHDSFIHRDGCDLYIETQVLLWVAKQITIFAIRLVNGLEAMEMEI